MENYTIVHIDNDTLTICVDHVAATGTQAAIEACQNLPERQNQELLDPVVFKDHVIGLN